MWKMVMSTERLTMTAVYVKAIMLCNKTADFPASAKGNCIPNENWFRLGHKCLRVPYL